jgi:RNA polymerase sigma-70 factor (ECF subfamily)
MQSPAVDPPDEHEPRAPAEDNDALVIAQIRNGSHEAFDALYATHVRSLIGFTDSYVRSIAVAEDIVADLFVHLWLHRQDWSPKHGVRAYLFSAARNRAFNHVRNQSRASQTIARIDGDSDGVTATMPHPLDYDASSEVHRNHAALVRAVQALPPDRRRLIVLRWNQELTVPQIAAILGTSVKAVEQQLLRTIRALRKKFLSPP